MVRWSVEYEKTKKVGSGISAQVGKAGVKRDIEQQLRSTYTLSENQTNTHTEEISVKVPGNTILEVYIDWKQILAHGVVQLRDQAGNTSEVPFVVAVGVTFDQRQFSWKP